MNPSLKKWLRRCFWATVVLFVAIQFIRPEQTNPASDPAKSLEAILKPPPDVANLLSSACNDCHSHGTTWPWYSQIAPVSWLVAEDVKDGRKHVNFSKFGETRGDKQAKILHECAEEVAEDVMPPNVYRLTHGAARLSQDDRRKLAAWFESAAASHGGRRR
jgi:hypothetical protein